MELDMYWTLGLEASDGWPWKMPVSVTPWLSVPAGLTSLTGSLVASGNGVGLLGAAVVSGTGVGWEELVGAVSEVAVAEDPHANNKRTNKRTIAFGR